MANEKISAMTTASQVANADIVPIVQGAANKKATRTVLLTGAAGEDIVIQGSTGQSVKLLSADGQTEVWIRDDGFIYLRNLNTFLQILGNGDTDFDSGGRLNLHANGTMAISCNSGNPNVLYNPGNPTDWSGSPPTDVATALDRIASALVTVLGGPIP